MSRLHTALAALVLLIPAIATAQPSPLHTARDTTPIAITGVTVIDVERGRRLPGHTVLVRGMRIAAVGPTARVRVPRGARLVNARGKFLIPGLWDMHVHTFIGVSDSTDLTPAFFPLFVANGVTGVRDMATDLTLLHWVRRLATELIDDNRLGPRVLGSGSILDGVPATLPHQIPIATAADARRVVDSLTDGGAVFIKIYNRLSRDAYFAVADQARRRGIPFAGHVPASVTHAEASDAGQRTFEHLVRALSNCSEESLAIQSRFDELLRAPGRSADSARALARARDRAIVDRFAVEECASLFARFVRNGTWQVPTLSVNEWRLRHQDSLWTADPRLRFIPTAVKREWATGIFPSIRGAGPADVALWRKTFRAQQAVVGAMQAAGVPILAGTDAWQPYVLPGFSLHEELALLVESGLTPLQALRAATLNPARFLNATDSLGTISRGKLADLVLLDADPLGDIRNSTRIRAVFMNGRYLDRRALNRLLIAAELAAAAPVPAKQ